MMSETAIETVSPPISFDTHHDDVIHDAKVDFFGRKLATASSDRTIRIFQINDNQTETLLSILSGHEGPVWQIAWAHPKFGAILGSCSYDGTVIIWQEDSKKPSINGVSPSGTHATWNKIKVHKAHESSVNSISFSPHSYGLSLACASSDGKVSVITRSEETNDEWSIQEFEAHPTGCNSIAWCPSSVPSSLLELNFNALDEKPVSSGPKILATGGCDNTVKLWKFEEDKWTLDVTLSDHNDWVRDVCWRPNLGQVGHLLASCSQDNTVLLWRFDDESKKWISKPLKPEPFPDTLWRVSFSEYGHLLAVSCGDNTVTLWRENPSDGVWLLVGNVDESISESLTIDEPLAVSPPEIAPEPKIEFSSNSLPDSSSLISPMTSAHVAPGYIQGDDAYETYQHAQFPTVPIVEPPPIHTEFQDNCTISESYPEITQYTGYDQIVGTSGGSTHIDNTVGYVAPDDDIYSANVYNDGSSYGARYNTYGETSYDNNYEQNYSNDPSYNESSTITYDNEVSYAEPIFESQNSTEPSDQAVNEVATNGTSQEYSSSGFDYGEKYDNLVDNYSSNYGTSGDYDPNIEDNLQTSDSLIDNNITEYADNSDYNSYADGGMYNGDYQTGNYSTDQPGYNQNFNKDIGFTTEPYEESKNFYEAATYNYDSQPELDQQYYQQPSEIEPEETKEKEPNYTLQYEGYQGHSVSQEDDQTQL